MNPLEIIKAAYERALVEHLATGPKNQDRAPQWDRLPLGLRLAMIEVYYQGRHEASAEIVNQISKAANAEAT